MQLLYSRSLSEGKVGGNPRVISVAQLTQSKRNLPTDLTQGANALACSEGLQVQNDRGSPAVRKCCGLKGHLGE